MVQLDNPYAPTNAAGDAASYLPSPRPLHIWWWGSISLLTASLMIGSILAACAAFIDVESIIASGPILFVIALLQTFISFFRRVPWLAITGIAVLLFAIGCFIAIYQNQWSPSDAQKPISIAIGLFTLLLNTQWLTLWYHLTLGSTTNHDATNVQAAPNQWS